MSVRSPGLSLAGLVPFSKSRGLEEASDWFRFFLSFFPLLFLFLEGGGAAHVSLVEIFGIVSVRVLEVETETETEDHVLSFSFVCVGCSL